MRRRLTHRTVRSHVFERGDEDVLIFAWEAFYCIYLSRLRGLGRLCCWRLQPRSEATEVKVRSQSSRITDTLKLGQ